jgi:Fe-S-cluster containining protein
MLTGLVQIRRLGEAKTAENLHFRRYVSARRLPLDRFRSLAADISRDIDCTQCANCCRNGLVAVSRAEMEEIAAYLQIEPAEVNRLYTTPDPDGRGRVLLSVRDGCVFLDGNLCMIYAARPRACRDFPHVASAKRSLGSRMASLCGWAPLCPIVYNSLEAYKRLIGYHPARKSE